MTVLAPPSAATVLEATQEGPPSLSQSAIESLMMPPVSEVPTLPQTGELLLPSGLFLATVSISLGTTGGDPLGSR